VKTADKLLWFKYVVKNVALRNGKTVTFMPKPLFGDNGSGMHTHQSIWNKGKPLFAGEGYAGISETALHYIGGILKHARALAAICNPTTNSYKRLVPGFEAPVNLAYSSRNRSAAIRIPMYSPSPKAKRIEFRSPDPSCNPYLAFAAMLMAGLDGIENRIDPGDPLDKDIYGLSPEELKDVPKMPGSLEEALGELKKDHEFLLKGDVFTPDVVEAWIDTKVEKELNPVRLRPTPMEFALYFDI
jgi:glutamine synthetase